MAALAWGATTTVRRSPASNRVFAVGTVSCNPCRRGIAANPILPSRTSSASTWPLPTAVGVNQPSNPMVAPTNPPLSCAGQRPKRDNRSPHRA